MRTTIGFSYSSRTSGEENKNPKTSATTQMSNLQQNKTSPPSVSRCRRASNAEREREIEAGQWFRASLSLGILVALPEDKVEHREDCQKVDQEAYKGEDP
mmetsp:Transcript_2027/g.4629  ORF Transcript_2027/g.4629 Transcript_2027/m.4629 type:complete len:100 (-) Transcript_2027:427-726(-)